MPNILVSHVVLGVSASSKSRRNKRSGFVLLARNKGNKQKRIVVISPKENE